MPFGGFCPLPIRLGGDAETGWNAQQHARSAANLVAYKRTAPLAWFTWSAPSGADTAAVITAYSGMNGAGPAYQPVAGVVSSPSAGLTFLWSTGKFTDDYQVTAPFLPRVAHITFAGSTYRKATYQLRTNGIIIYAWDAAGSIVNPQPGGTCSLY
jgi:hypothetical protein